MQDPADTRYGSMPRNVIAGDDVDLVLPLAGIADTLVTLALGGTVDAKKRQTTAR